MFGWTEEQTMRVVYLVALLVFVSGGFVAFRSNLPQALRQLGIWVLLLLGLIAIYAYRDPLLRFAEPVIQELAPSRVVARTGAEGPELVVARGDGGHFFLQAEVNGASIRFLVDTGATSTVLAYRDAERAGIAVEVLEFTRPVQTAAGRAYQADARVRSLEIGPYELSDIRLGVMPAGTLDMSLLGMNVLNQFRSWRIERDRLVLIP